MSMPDQINQSAPPASSSKMLTAMVGIGVMCALLIVLTYEGTFSRIEQNKAEALEKAIFKVLPGISSKASFALENDKSFSVLGENEETENEIFYAGYNDAGELVGLAIEASGLGFADVIRILYGYDPVAQTVVGFYVLESKETPGLGDKIEKDLDFLANFDALDVSLNEDGSEIKNLVVPVKKGKKVNPWEVDGITGATISSRAIGNIIGASSSYWMPIIYNNQDLLKNNINEDAQ